MRSVWVFEDRCGHVKEQEFAELSSRRSVSHPSRSNAAIGQHVKQGDTIGCNGNSGALSKPPHLHFELRKRLAQAKGRTNRIDPCEFFREPNDCNNGGRSLHAVSPCGTDSTIPSKIGKLLAGQP